jgi:hypothetical protein
MLILPVTVSISTDVAGSVLGAYNELGREQKGCHQDLRVSILECIFHETSGI